jgi:hypothetical protein
VFADSGPKFPVISADGEPPFESSRLQSNKQRRRPEKVLAMVNRAARRLADLGEIVGSLQCWT